MILKEIRTEDSVYKYFQGLINTGHDLICSFWRELMKTTESRLDGQIIGRERVEIEVIKNRYVALPSMPKATLIDDQREADICFVLGSSGSGKTFFSVMVAAEYEAVTQNRFNGNEGFNQSVTLHVTDTFRIVEDAVKKVKEDIYSALGQESNSTEEWESLKMHLSIVIDEATSLFEDKADVLKLYNLLKDVAKSIRLIISGTGMTAVNYLSQTEVIKYRMKPWENNDIAAVRTIHFKEIKDCVMEFSINQKILNSLATNARSAWFLLAELCKVSINHEKLGETDEEIKKDLRVCSQVIVSSILNSVAIQYIRGNGLAKLSPFQRRRVAASVFTVVEQATQEAGPTIPDFECHSLVRGERKVAMSLVDSNVEYKDFILQYADESKKSVSVSLAVVIILFKILGVVPENLVGWRGQETMVALTAFRRLAIQAFTTTPDTLRNIEYVSLTKPVPATSAKTIFRIPVFQFSTVWINGERAPFADVVSPFHLYQCKHVSNEEKCVFNLEEEGRKCGILKDDQKDKANIGWAILSVLFVDWEKQMVNDQSAVLDLSNSTADEKTSVSLTTDDTRNIWSYPEQRLKQDAMVDDADINFVDLSRDKEKSNDSWKLNNKKNVLGNHLTKEVTFVISTNARVLELKFGKLIKVTILPCDVDKNGIWTNSESQQNSWKRIQDKIKSNVTLRFMFG
jgi:hypothetical protein